MGRRRRGRLVYTPDHELASILFSDYRQARPAEAHRARIVSYRVGEPVVETVLPSAGRPLYAPVLPLHCDPDVRTSCLIVVELALGRAACHCGDSNRERRRDTVSQGRSLPSAYMLHRELAL